MRTVLFIAICFFILGCEDVFKETERPVKIRVIDDCEYLEFKGYQTYSLTHKGNCKFCIQRNKK